MTIRTRRTALAFLLAVVPALTHAADGPCAVAERDFSYWVFGSNAAFNIFRSQCAAGKTAPEALIASQRGNPAALAQMRECGAEMVALLMDRKMDQMCEQLAKPAALAAPRAPSTPAASATPPACALNLQGTYIGYGRNDNAPPDAAASPAVTLVWQTREGKTAGNGVVPNYGSSVLEVVGTDGPDLVVKVVSTIGANRYDSMSKYRFDPNCASYSGTTRRGDVTGTIWGTRVGG